MVIEPQMADFLGSTASSKENGVVSGGCFTNATSLATNSYPTYLPTANSCSSQMVAAGGLSSPCSSSSSSVVVPSISVILTVRLLMQGKEVGSIIGKRGDHVKLIRDKSGAKVNISDGSCPERIVTITGNTNTIHAAFAMVARKFEEDLQALPNSVPKPPITMRLIVPATQCGSLIGKGGSKIKEIREKTGASIQVATEMLPSSTERAVTISGTCEALTDCMHEICQILLEAPPKGATLPFRPKPSYNPLMVASSAAAAAAAQQQASQHIAAALLQQGGANSGQQPYGSALNGGGAPSSMPTHHSTTVAALQELARLHPSFSQLMGDAGSSGLVPVSSSSMMTAKQSPYNTNQQEINISNIAALLGSFPPQMGNIANLMPNPALSMIATSSSSSGGQPFFINQPTVSLPYGAIDPVTAMAFIQQQQQQQQLGQSGLWSHGGDKQQQQLMASIAAQQHQQLQHQQQQYELLQSLGYVNPTAYALTNNSAPNGQGTAVLGKPKLDGSSTTTTAVCNTASVSAHANGTSSLGPAGPNHHHSKSTRFSPY